MFHEDTEDLGFQDAPRLSIVLADGDEIRSVKDLGDTLDAHESDSEGGDEGSSSVEDLVGSSVGHDGDTGDEFERSVVGRRLGLDKHGSDCDWERGY